MGGLFGGGHSVVNRADMIGEFQINTASYGEIVPEVLGTTRLSGNVIYWDDFTAHEHRHSQRVGKGGGGSTVTEITYTYTVAVAIGLCEGPITGIGQVWRNKDIYAYPSSGIELTLFDGRHGQEPWPYVTGKHPDKALPYSGLAYMAGVVDLGSSGALPNFNFEVRGKLLDTGDGTDVNPADYIAYVLNGIGIKESNIEGLDNYRRYCAAADLLISTPPDGGSKKAQAIVNEIADITNAYVFWSHDRLKIVPLADKPVGGWSPDKEVKYDLTADDFLPMGDGTLVQYRRKESTQSYNQATVEFINRSNGYEKETVAFDVVADVQRNGLKPAPLVSAHYLYTKKRAQYLAELLALRQLYARNEYTFRLDWAFGRLEPGDLLTITDEATKLKKRVVVVTAVREAKDGELEISAVGRPPGVYSPARYDVHENERPFVDYNAAPPAITDTLILQPPVDLTLDGNEVWLGVNAPDGWGGCNVWLSDTGEHYKYAGSIRRKARLGRIVEHPQDAGRVTVRLDSGELRSGSVTDAENGNTACWCEGEVFSYTDAQLQVNGNYMLTVPKRAQFNTFQRDMQPQDRFARLDEAFFRYRYRDIDVGKTVYIKLTSVNIFGGHEQELSEVEPIQYTIQQYFIPDVSGLRLHTRYHELSNGAKSFDVVATFEKPTGFESYDGAEAWYREQGTAEWKFGGRGDGQIVISGCELGKTYEVRVQVKDIHDHYSAGRTESIHVEMKAEVPNTPEGFSIRFADAVYFNWLEVTNADVDFYEVRLDQSPGETAGRIGRSNNTTFVTDTLPARQGTVYLYAHNPTKGYSAPAILEYNVVAPPMPSDVHCTPKIEGFAISFAPIPGGCKGANVYVNEELIVLTTNVAFVPTEGGVHEVVVAYFDVFGEGERTPGELVDVKITIPQVLKDAENATKKAMESAMADIDRRIQEGLENVDLTELRDEINATTSRVAQLSNAIDSKVTDAKRELESRITQISDGIELKVQQGVTNMDGEKFVRKLASSVSSLRLGSQSITLDSPYIKIGGQVQMSGSAIIKAINTDSLSSDKISSRTLSSMFATIGHFRSRTYGARMEIQDSLLTVYDANGRLRVKLGVW